jgi:hypothetical protein
MTIQRLVEVILQNAKEPKSNRQRLAHFPCLHLPFALSPLLFALCSLPFANKLPQTTLSRIAAQE